MPSLLPGLRELFTDEVTIAFGTKDDYGAFTPSGTVVTVPARISQRIMLVRNLSGNEVVSKLQAVLWGVPGATVSCEYTLPARFDPRDPPAIAVSEAADETGPHHQRVYF